MDVPTILAVISCATVFTGWLVLPHRWVDKVDHLDVETRERVPVSAA